MERVIKNYRELTRIPLLGYANIIQGMQGSISSVVTVDTTWKQHCLTRGKEVTFHKQFTLDSGYLSTVSISQPLASPNDELFCEISSSGNLKAVLRKDSEAKQFLEIWQHGSLWHCWDIEALDFHGNIYADAQFGSLKFSSDESSIVYIAEKKRPKTESFYKQKKPKKEDDSVVVKGGEFEFYEDWGEQMVGKHQPAVYIMEVQTGSVRTIDHIPQEVFCQGQVMWNPSGDGVVGVSYNTTPRRLGIIYCTNRESRIFHATLSKDYHTLSDDGNSVRSPRFSPDGSTLVWLQRTAFGPHHMCHKLVKCCWKTGEVSTVVDIVKRPPYIFDSSDEAVINDDRFCGIYCQSLPNHCWANDNSRIVFSTPRDDQNVPLVVDSGTGNVTVLPVGIPGGSCIILNIPCGMSMTVPPTLLVARLPSPGKEHEIKWNRTENLEIPGLEGKTCKTLFLRNPTPHPDPTYSDVVFNAFGFMPTTAASTRVPLIVIPHGGPHGVLSHQYFLFVALMAKLGVASLLINYRGSAGSGDDNICSLIGQVGQVDVSDVIVAVKAFTKKYDIDEQKIGLFGGSHGGFLVTHLCGQFPEQFCCVVARNPVTNIESLYSVTDIPDWSWVESGLDYQSDNIADKTVLSQMREVSPLQYVPQVCAPVLMLLGTEDRRVHMSQGVQYYHAMRAHGKRIKMHIYDDCHPLAKVPVQADSLTHSAIWFMEHFEDQDA